MVAVHIISGKRRSCAFITIVQAYEICECLAKKNIFYLDLNRESMRYYNSKRAVYYLNMSKLQCIVLALLVFSVK